MAMQMTGGYPAVADIETYLTAIGLEIACKNNAGAKLKVRRRYSQLAQEIAPTGFRIYIDSGTGFDFATAESTAHPWRQRPNATQAPRSSSEAGRQPTH